MQGVYTAVRTKNHSLPCDLCSIGSICIPRLINHTLSTVVHRKQSVAKDDVIVNSGMPFTKFYIVHSGSLKSYVESNDGGEQVNGFYLPGDIIGLDAIFTKKYKNNIKALTTRWFVNLIIQN